MTAYETRIEVTLPQQCSAGHLLDEGSVYISHDGSTGRVRWYCRKCKRAEMKHAREDRQQIAEGVFTAPRRRRIRAHAKRLGTSPSTLVSQLLDSALDALEGKGRSR